MFYGSVNASDYGDGEVQNGSCHRMGEFQEGLTDNAPYNSID